MAEAVAILSGGLDSCTLVQHLMNDGKEVIALSFDYGQRHKKELWFATAFCGKRGIQHHTIDLSSITPLIAVSSLTSSKMPVPQGHYAEATMTQTVVPNRNMIMLSIAAGVAVANGAAMIGTGVHGGDHFVYPDCRPEFIDALQKTVRLGNEGLSNPYLEVFTPFARMTKAQIAYLAFQSGVVFHETWSCYEGGEVHCGKCGTCVERLEAIDISGYTQYDQTEYADKEYWKTVVQSPEVV